MVVDQQEIDRLLAQANQMVTEAAAERQAAERQVRTGAVPGDSGAPPGVDASSPIGQAAAGGPAGGPDDATPPDATTLSPEVRRLLRLRLPIMVRLAERRMTVADLMKISPGTIIEFAKSGDSELDLMINNRVIGHGSAVKVNENFGLRITSIGNVNDRIRSMGSADRPSRQSRPAVRRNRSAP